MSIDREAPEEGDTRALCNYRFRQITGLKTEAVVLSALIGDISFFLFFFLGALLITTGPKHFFKFQRLSKGVGVPRHGGLND